MIIGIQICHGIRIQVDMTMGMEEDSWTGLGILIGMSYISCEEVKKMDPMDRFSSAVLNFD